MEKLVYVLWRGPDDDPAALSDDLIERAGPALLADPGGVRVHGVRLEVEAPEASFMRQGAADDGSLLSATVSVWLDSIDERGAVEEVLRGAPAAALHGWLVTESVPKGYGPQRTWPDGERSPGISITTMFDKRPDIDDERFFAVWHGEHTPLTFELHPFWLYVRNVAVRAMTTGAPPCRAIVYEAMPDTQDLFDLHRFFGSGGDDRQLKANIDRVNAHLPTFADYPKLQTTPTWEHILRTFST